MQLKFFHDVKCIIFIIEVLLLSPFINNFFGIILTYSTNHDILCHKSHRFCGLVWNHPQDVVVFILNTASPWIIPKRLTAPQHTRFILPPIHPDKIHRCAAWAVFFFMGNVPWKFHKPTERDTDFPSTPLHKQGQELRSEQTVIPLHEQHNLYLFLCLNNSETTPGNAFWAQR